MDQDQRQEVAEFLASRYSRDHGKPGNVLLDKLWCEWAYTHPNDYFGDVYTTITTTVAHRIFRAVRRVIAERAY